MAEYVKLDTEVLEMRFSGYPIDLVSLGIAQVNLQHIVEKVASDMLTVEGLLTHGAQEGSFSRRYPPLIQVQLRAAGTGSYYSIFEFAVVTAFSDPIAIAVLTNLASNVIWAVGMSGLQIIRHNLKSSMRIPKAFRQPENDPYQVQALVREIIVAAQQNPGLETLQLNVTPEWEVEIKLKYSQNGVPQLGERSYEPFGMSSSDAQQMDSISKRR